jgi:hypothetical protein
MRTPDPVALREAMRGVRALLLDLDGVIVVAGEAVAGSVEAIAELERRRVPYRIVTNTSLVSRRPCPLRGEARQRHPARAVPVGAVGVGGVRRRRLPRASRSTCSRQPTPGSSSTASGC